MELQYIVLTIIKILISVPAIVLLSNSGADCAALIGGHVNNNNSSKANATYEFKIDLSDEITQELADNSTERFNSEEIPDPEPLVVPGYNLPENIFNRGKPFYLEKDPLTGNVDFENKSPKIYDEYEYEEEQEHDGIDRRDGPSSGSHKNSDINQLTPNFHDFLNLPVKYNPNKYVYPLISNSYANTKVQGNVNKQHNHKNYVVTTYKPHLNPTYYTTRKYFGQKVIGGNPHRNDLEEEFTSSTKAKPYSFTEQFASSTKANFMKHYGTTTVGTTTTTTMRPVETSTKKLLSLFEQLFGSDYEDSVEVTEATVSTQQFTSTQHVFPSSTPKVSTQNVLTGSNMAYEPNSIHITTKSEYEDYEYEDKSTTSTTGAGTTPATTTTTTTTTTTAPVVASSVLPSKITSLPLGENHVTQSNRQPIIITNLRDQLNNEKVIIQAPSTSNIHIAPDQDTVSFVVGNQQSVEGVGSSYESPIASYDNTPVGSPYDNNPFRPVYGSDSTIQPIREASLAIGVPVNRLRGQVVDEEPPSHSKIVFPDATEAPVNREVLKLSSKPMFHQLPSDLTPPDKEKIRQQVTRIRPPWDPRPGHFHTGRPEYARPPRPNNEVYKRIDTLPNILPQFRPNMKYYHHHHPNKNYARQPLLERPSNRPIGFFEKLHPPPPPPPNRRQDDPIKNQTRQEPFPYLHAPPKVTIINRSGNDPETLQMIHAKQEQRKETPIKKEDKPLYVVYPVNTRPLKLDAIDTNKESVVIGTRAELPLPPSKIQQPAKEFNYEMKERNDAPILKPRPQQFPLKSNFPYPLERPDPSILETTVDVVENNLPDEPSFSSNQWNTIETHQPPSNQISVTLKTYTTEKPIAVAYTPTESDLRFSMPNYASLVIPEIRDEFTVNAVMHARPQKLDRIDEETTAQDFQAPFQASAHVDSMSQGWSVVKDKDERKIEATTLPVATTSEFDIENFKPQLEGGFKPIYSYPDDKKEMVISERQE